jgi:hypothetical protein
MALPGNNNSISLSQLQAEFGGTDPISLTEYYRGGDFVTSNNTSVPTTGEISMTDFFNTEKMFFYTISANVADFNLMNAATAEGYTEGDPITLTINSGVYVYGESSAALTASGNFGQITIHNYGYIIGKGGSGGSPSGAGGNGDTGISTTKYGVIINNYSGAFICGGGGGGSGGNGWAGGGGGAGGGRGGNFTYSGGGNGGAGGGPGQKGSNGASKTGYGWGAGGNAGGQGGSGESNPGTDDVGAGGGGGRKVPGASVRVDSGGNNNGWGGTGAGGGRNGGNSSGRGGGGGGGWGANGGRGGSGSLGGVAGYAIYSGRVVVTNQGTIYGNVRQAGKANKNYGTDGENEYDLDGNLA